MVRFFGAKRSHHSFAFYYISPSPFYIMRVMSSNDQERIAAANTDYIFTATYAMVSGLTVVVFDQVISFGLEVDLVWMRRSSTRKYFVGTAAYVMLRYVGLIWAISEFCLNMGVPSTGYRCYQVYNVQQVAKYVLICLLQGMMAVRVWILLGAERRVFFILLTAFVISQGLSLVDAMLSIMEYTGGSDYLDENDVEGCSLINTTPSWNKWLVPWSKGLLVAFELLLCLLAIIHLVKRARTHGASSCLMGNVVSTLVRDNLLYFFLAFFILLVTALEEIKWVESSMGLYWITFSALKYVFYGVIGPWMMLDLRKESYSESAVSSATNLKLSLLPRSQPTALSDYEELPSPVSLTY